MRKKKIRAGCFDWKGNVDSDLFYYSLSPFAMKPTTTIKRRKKRLNGEASVDAVASICLSTNDEVEASQNNRKQEEDREIEKLARSRFARLVENILKCEK